MLLGAGPQVHAQLKRSDLDELAIKTALRQNLSDLSSRVLVSVLPHFVAADQSDARQELQDARSPGSGRRHHKDSTTYENAIDLAKQVQQNWLVQMLEDREHRHYVEEIALEGQMSIVLDVMCDQMEVRLVLHADRNITVEPISLREARVGQEQGKAPEANIEDAAVASGFGDQPVGLAAPLAREKDLERAVTSGDLSLFDGQTTMMLDRWRLPLSPAPRSAVSALRCSE